MAFYNAIYHLGMVGTYYYRRKFAGSPGVAPFHLCLHIALRHALHACIVMGSQPGSIDLVVQQLAISGRQKRSLACKQYVQDPVALLAQRKAHRIRMTIRGKPGTRFRITQIAARLQLFLAWLSACVSRRGTRSRPACSQRQPPRERPIGLEPSFRHEIRTGHQTPRNCEIHRQL